MVDTAIDRSTNVPADTGTHVATHAATRAAMLTQWCPHHGAHAMVHALVFLIDMHTCSVLPCHIAHLAQASYGDTLQLGLQQRTRSEATAGCMTIYAGETGSAMKWQRDGTT